ncbi:MAG TPA: archaeosortase/exosortase family protein [Myxococcota bacterium]|nr:archaeosortase/exosortase family protein [Myxococcota bacterium]
MERRAGLGCYVSWIALAVAFSPVLVDLARNWVAEPTDRVVLIAPLLLLLALRRGTANGRAGSGLAAGSAIAIGIALELLGLLSETRSIARIGLPIAALGVAGWNGRPALAVAALVFFAIPIPDTLLLLASPALESAVVEAAGSILQGLGASVQAHGSSLVASGGRINLHPMDGGATLAIVLGALGWYSAARLGEGVRRCGRRAALLCLLALPLQVLVVVVTGALLAAGHLDASRFWLRHGAWITVFLLGLACVHRGSLRFA